MKKIFIVLAVALMSMMSMSMMATTHTSFTGETHIVLGDTVALNEDTEMNFGHDSLFAGRTYTLVRGNIESGDAYGEYKGVVKADDGAYLMFEDGDGNLFPPARDKDDFAFTISTDGIKVSTITCMGTCYYTFRRFEHSDDFYDDADDTKNRLDSLKDNTIYQFILHRYFSDSCFTPICLPFDYDEEAIAHTSFLYDSELYTFEGAAMNGDSLDLYIKQVDTIEAGVPYIMRMAMYGFYEEDFDNVTIKTSEGATIGTGVQFVGSMCKTQVTADNDDYLFLGAKDSLYWPEAGETLNGFRAYFKVNSVAPHGTPARLVVVDGPVPEPTALDETNADTKTIKRIVNGQLLILRDGKVYNATGRRVK